MKTKKQHKEELAKQGLKQCPRCDEPKLFSEFGKDKGTKDGLQYLCKEHRKEYRDKSLSTMTLIGCDIDYFMYYIQKKFTKGMSWDNYGDWHIDHIKPCTKFDLSKPNEQLKCFNYTNLQPLWAVDNLKKGNKYNG